MPRQLRIRIVLSLLLALGAAAPARAQTNEALLDTLQHAGVMYFWNEANPANGLIKDRSTPGSFCSIAANGFGFSAIAIGAERGWIDKDQARARTLLTLQTFWNGPQGGTTLGTIGNKGFFYHFLDMNTATRYATDVEPSTIDTALLFAGIRRQALLELGAARRHPDPRARRLDHLPRRLELCATSTRACSWAEAGPRLRRLQPVGGLQRGDDPLPLALAAATGVRMTGVGEVDERLSLPDVLRL